MNAAIPIAIVGARTTSTSREPGSVFIGGVSGHVLQATRTTAEAALAALPTPPVDGVLLEVNLPSLNGMEAREQDNS